MRRWRRNRAASRRGMVLVTCLWVLLLLTFLAVSVVYRVRLSCAVADYQWDELAADALLDAGLARALWAIRQDQDTAVDFGGEPWAEGRQMREEGLIPLEYLDQKGPIVRWKVTDVGRKLNINTIRDDVLRSVLDAYYGLDIDTDLLADYISDWIDPDAEGFAEGDFYALGNYPYTPRNDVIPFIGELQAVRDIPPWLFHGEDWDGDGQLDAAENDGSRRFPDDNADGQLQIGLCDLFTVVGDGTVNVNTVPDSILKALFRSFVATDEAADLATQLNQARVGVDGLVGTGDDRPFESTEEIAKIVGQTLYTQCRNAGAPLGVGSPAFEVSVYVDLESQRIEIRGHGLVIRTGDAPKLAYWHPGF